MSRFVSEPGDIRFAEDPWHPHELTTIPQLLDNLHVRDAAPDVQRKAVDGWLRNHKPGRLLAAFLKEDGYRIPAAS